MTATFIGLPYGDKMSKICRYLTMYYIDDTIRIHKCFDIASSPPSPDEPFSPVFSYPYPPSEIVTIASDED